MRDLDDLILDGDSELYLEGLDGEADAKYMVSNSDIPIYDGEYVVIPQAYDSTVLATQGKTLTSNVTVVEIPKVETINASGGLTVSIAS